MSFLHTIRIQIERLWRFLGFFQSPCTRILHALLFLFVVMQIIGGLTMSPGSFIFWFHAWSGATLFALACVQVAVSFSIHGVRHFFSYLWGDVEQIEKDVRQSLKFQIVGPRPKGLAASVQGLGLGALLLAGLTGMTWFWLMQTGSPAADTLRSIHKFAAVLVILYLLGHGILALIHFYIWEEKVPQKDA